MLLCLTGVAVALPAGPPYPAYAPAPYHPAPQPFAYQYSVTDTYSSALFNAQETPVSGTYQVALPDGRQLFR